jgi:hypothetical protein
MSREIVGRRKAVPVAADDDDIVGRFRAGVAPSRLPAAMAEQGLMKKTEDRVCMERFALG